MAQTRTRLYAFVHIANVGLTPFPVAELYNIDFAQVDACAKTIAENADIALGAKVRMSENVIAKHGTEPLKRAIMACETVGHERQDHVPHRRRRNAAADVARSSICCGPGDILTHAYSGAPNIAGAFTNIVQDGKLLPAALAAKQRGVIFDVGHGGGSFDYTVAEAAIAHGCAPGYDLVRHPRVLRQFAGHAVSDLGDEQIHGDSASRSSRSSRWRRSIRPRSSTARRSSARLQIGAPADVAIMDLVEGPVSFVDTRNNKRDGKAYLKPVQTVTGGVPFGRPYMSPFAVR